MNGLNKQKENNMKLKELKTIKCSTLTITNKSTNKTYTDVKPHSMTLELLKECFIVGYRANLDNSVEIIVKGKKVS